MRVVLDTNVLISALIAPQGAPSLLYRAWLEGRFDLVTSHDQLDEFKRASQYPRLKLYLRRSEAGALVNELRQVAHTLEKLPSINVSPDPADNFLLAMAQAADADYLVTGDRRDLLGLKRFGKTRIVTTREMLGLLN